MPSILEVIKQRRSIRQYQTQQIKEADVQTILEAARYAPSARNQQPWYFTVIQNQTLLDHMSTVAKKNMFKTHAAWLQERANNEQYHLFHRAPTVIVVSGLSDSEYAFSDCCAAIQNMLLAAESLGLGSCWIGLARYFFAEKKEVEKLGIPAGYTPFYTICLGYKKDLDSKRTAPVRKKEVVGYIR